MNISTKYSFGEEVFFLDAAHRAKSGRIREVLTSQSIDDPDPLIEYRVAFSETDTVVREETDVFPNKESLIAHVSGCDFCEKQ